MKLDFVLLIQPYKIWSNQQGLEAAGFKTGRLLTKHGGCLQRPKTLS